MNIYDFDGTIYDGDSGVNFIKFMILKKPFYMIWHFLKSTKYVILYKLKKIDFKRTKEYIFSFVTKIDNLDKYTNEFAEKNKSKIKPFYNLQKNSDDVIVSASLDFYLVPLCKKMNIENIICTEYDIKNGKIKNENCKGEEKVLRFNNIYGENTIAENSYGDSKSDIPILKRAQNGFMIVGNKIEKLKE